MIKDGANLPGSNPASAVILGKMFNLLWHGLSSNGKIMVPKSGLL